jgi:hypothetical protein
MRTPGCPQPALAITVRWHLTVTIDTPGTFEDRLDAACLATAKKEADATVSLEEARRILAKAPGSLALAVIADREER